MYWHLQQVSYLLSRLLFGFFCGGGFNNSLGRTGLPHGLNWVRSRVRGPICFVQTIRLSRGGSWLSCGCWPQRSVPTYLFVSSTERHHVTHKVFINRIVQFRFRSDVQMDLTQNTSNSKRKCKKDSAPILTRTKYARDQRGRIPIIKGETKRKGRT